MMLNCVTWTRIVSITNIKTKDFYKDISNDVENRFDTSKL